MTSTDAQQRDRLAWSLGLAASTVGSHMRVLKRDGWFSV